MNVAVKSWLDALGLGAYAEVFAANPSGGTRGDVARHELGDEHSAQSMRRSFEQFVGLECYRFAMLARDPVIEAYKRDVDRTLLRENLRLTPAKRLAKMVSALAFLEELRRATDRAKGR